MPLSSSTRHPLVALLVVTAALGVGSSALAQSRSVGAAPAGASRATGNLGSASSNVRGLPSASGLASPSRFPSGLPSPVQGTLASPVQGNLPPVVQGNLPSPQTFPGGVPSSVLLPSGAVDVSGATSGTSVPGSGLAPSPGTSTGGMAAGVAAAAAAAATAPDTATMGASGGAGVSGPPTRPYNPIDVSAAFAAADTNRDDELSRAEAELLRLRPGPFEQMDRDGNGRVTRFEYQDATGR